MTATRGGSPPANWAKRGTVTPSPNLSSASPLSSLARSIGPYLPPLVSARAIATVRRGRVPGPRSCSLPVARSGADRPRPGSRRRSPAGPPRTSARPARDASLEHLADQAFRISRQLAPLRLVGFDDLEELLRLVGLTQSEHEADREPR